MFLNKLMTVLICIFAIDSVAQAMIRVARHAKKGRLNYKVARVMTWLLIALLILVVYGGAHLLRVMEVI